MPEPPSRRQLVVFYRHPELGRTEDVLNGYAKHLCNQSYVIRVKRLLITKSLVYVVAVSAYECHNFLPVMPALAISALIASAIAVDSGGMCCLFTTHTYVITLLLSTYLRTL